MEEDVRPDRYFTVLACAPEREKGEELCWRNVQRVII